MELIDREKLLKELKTSADYHEENSRDYVLMLRDRNIVREQPTVEAIPKADYEARLKADIAAILTDIHIEMLLDLKHEIQEIEKTVDSNTAAYWWKEGIRDSVNVIQSRINILKAVQEKRSEYDKD